jgi:tetratricopeptide (TPR) repeat protein
MRVKLFFISIFPFLFFTRVNAQFISTASPNDSAQINPLIRKIETYFFISPDSTLQYAEEILALTNRTKNYPFANFAYQMAGEAYRGKGDFSRSLEMQFNALELNRKNKDRRGEAYTFSFIGFTYLQLSNYSQALKYLLPAKKVLDSTRDWIQSSFTSSNTAYCYTMLDVRDSAYYFNRESSQLMDSIDNWEPRKMALRTLINDRLGNEFERVGNLEKAAYHYRLTLFYALQDGIGINISRGQKTLLAFLCCKIRTTPPSSTPEMPYCIVG